jgi:hypothetical protein
MHEGSISAFCVGTTVLMDKFMIPKLSIISSQKVPRDYSALAGGSSL